MIHALLRMKQVSHRIQYLRQSAAKQEQREASLYDRSREAVCELELGSDSWDSLCYASEP